MQEVSLNSSERIMNEIMATHTPEGTVAVWFFGQESVTLKGRETIIYVDPYFSDYVEELYGVKRSYPAVIRPQHVRAADLVLITHEHEDHLDPITLKAMLAQCPEIRFVAPLSCRLILEERCGIASDRITDARTGEWMEIEGRGGERLRVQPIPAAHESLETLGNDWSHRYVGYLIDIHGVTVYHAGDTLVYPGLTEQLAEAKIDLGLLPINGRDYYRTSRGIVGNMNYREAAELAYAAGMDTVIPLHYDLFDGNSEKPGAFLQELYERYPSQKCHVMARGERFVYASPRAFL